MKTADFDYILPEELIAQKPSEKRENSRMMVLNRENKTIESKHFFDIVDLIDENSILVLNNTKVIPARLYTHKSTGALIEMFLLKEVENKMWEVLIRPAKRVKVGMELTFGEGARTLRARLAQKLEEGKWLVELDYAGNFYEVLDEVGNIPLPPYIERKMTDNEFKTLDYERYQTVYAQKEGSVAAPTAGLHFTKEILEKLKSKGVEIAYVTLNVGLGTFRPVKCEDILEHKMDSETFEISAETAEKINQAKAAGKKLVAVGTTTVRTLETAFKQFGEIKACRSASELFIYPPYEFKVVDNLITNFHLPKSTLLMLVSALAGKEFIFNGYEEAIKSGYRFYSYGDCMYIC